MMDSTENVAAISAQPKTATSAAPGTGHGIRVLQNTAVVFAARSMGLVFAAAANFMLVRYLGTERLGQYGAIYAYLSLFAWLASLGLAPILTREAAQARGQAASIIHTGVRIAAVVAVVTAALALAIAPLAHLSGKLLPLLAIGAVEIFLLVPVSLPGLIFQVDQRQWYNSGFNVIRQTLWLGVVIALYACGAPLLYVVLGRLAVAAVEAVLNWRVAQRFLDSSRDFLWDMAPGLVRGGLVLAATTVAAAIYMRIDQVMLHSMVGDKALGPYVAAVRISELFELVPAAFVSSLFPLLCISVAEPARFHRHLDLGYRYMVLGGAALSVLFCVGARPLVHLMYGAQYASSAPLLAVLIWSEVAIFFGSMLGNALIAAGLQRFLLWPAIVGAGVNVAINLFVIPRWGALGASWSTVISYWACWTLAFIPFRATRTILWKGFRVLAPITALALLITWAASLLRINDWARLGSALATFAALACLAGFVRRQDLEFAKSIWKTRLGTRNA